jgi:hypothetical protein
MANLDSDLIRRGDAQAQLRDAYKKTYTAARRQGYKAAMEIVAAVPARRQPVQYQPVIVVSPDIGHSHWFYAGGHRFCYNCGGEGDIRFVTRLCPHCGFIMDELHDLEIE